jgi:hypothetical protein
LFKSWGERVPAVGVPADVGATSCRAQLDLSEGAARLPYRFNSDKYRPPRTVAAPPVPEQQLTYKPSSVRDILTAGALEQIYRWFSRELRDLQGYSEDPPRKHRSNKPLVIDQSSFVGEARGSFWDLTTKPLSLMKRHLSGTPRLNAAAILAAAGADYPDKELLDGITHSVRMSGDDKMLIVATCSTPGSFRSPATCGRTGPTSRTWRPTACLWSAASYSSALTLSLSVRGAHDSNSQTLIVLSIPALKKEWPGPRQRALHGCWCPIKMPRRSKLGTCAMRRASGGDVCAARWHR